MKYIYKYNCLDKIIYITHDSIIIPNIMTHYKLWRNKNYKIIRNHEKK